MKYIRSYRKRELSHHGGGIPLMFGFFEPLKMDLVLGCFWYEKTFHRFQSQGLKNTVLGIRVVGKGSW